ncbi:MAG: histidine--tRNA ligase [Candidatus Kerfeldbacteria bacterium]|nr:histidine--tRNA ligase [Candidatus Kerfeldbacteria bacterium]
MKRPKPEHKPKPAEIAAAQQAVVDAERAARGPHLLRGMKDVLPVDQPYWSFIERTASDLARAYGYERIDPPVLESTTLFVRSVGEGTDIVDKEMYTFTDKGGDSVSLRPEFTASIARAYVEHGMVTLPQPVKLFTSGPLFRYERPQAGRYRQHSQLDVEVLGDPHPVVDAQVILLAHTLLTTLGLRVSVQVNSLGDPESRKDYIRKLTEYFRTKRKDFTEEQRERLKRNPLRLLDANDPQFRELTADAPQLVDHLSEDARKHFIGVLEYLDALDIPYELNPRLVRGFDYYTRTTFEIWPAGGEGVGQTALIGGGRYDRLIHELGGRPTPAVGFGGGIERLILALKEQHVAIPEPTAPQIFVAQLGDAARKKALQLFEHLRRSGFAVAENLSKDSLKTQLATASRLGVQYALILGQKEILDSTVLIRDMESGIQETVSYDRIAEEMPKRLRNRTAPPRPASPPAVPEEGTPLATPEPTEDV